MTYTAIGKYSYFDFITDLGKIAPELFNLKNEDYEIIKNKIAEEPSGHSLCIYRFHGKTVRVEIDDVILEVPYIIGIQDDRTVVGKEYTVVLEDLHGKIGGSIKCTFLDDVIRLINKERYNGP